MPSDLQHFSDLAKLAGERDHLMTSLTLARRRLDAALASAAADGLTITGIAAAAGLSRESTYMALRRAPEPDAPS